MRLIRIGKIFALLLVSLALTAAIKTCHQCRGINCQRTNYQKTEQCTNELDICVTVYEGQTLAAQGCLQQMPLQLRQKCENESENNLEAAAECQKCLGSLCNDVGPRGFECLQCDSTTDTKCRTDPSSVMPTKCPISRTNNAYCYVKDDGKNVVRGCSSSVKAQKECLAQKDCLLCSPFDLQHCNIVQLRDHDDDNGSGNGGNDGGNGGGHDNGNGGGNDGGHDNGGGGNDNGNGGGNGNDNGNGGDNDNGNGGGDDNGNAGGNDNGNGGGNVPASSSHFSVNFLTTALCFFMISLFLKY